MRTRGSRRAWARGGQSPVAGCHTYAGSGLAVKAYVAAALAIENADVLRQSAASLRKEAGIAEVRRNEGEISEADQAQIEITAAMSSFRTRPT